MKANFELAVPGENILILGFGLEGRSTARFLKSFFKDRKITVADRNENLLEEIDSDDFHDFDFILGSDYLKHLNQYDLVIKAPGIPKNLIEPAIPLDRVTSQTEIFLKLFRDQTIGITGTKGKSTTSSLIGHIFKGAGADYFLLGNIGKPPLDFAHLIGEKTLVIFEMSSHQLDGLRISPHVSVFLNLYEEHLDHYKALDNYRKAKYNIFQHQYDTDWLVYNLDDRRLSADINALKININKQVFSIEDHDYQGAFRINEGKIGYRSNTETVIYDFSGRKGIPGSHNLMNIMASVCVSKLLNVENGTISKAVNEFEGLEHRLEFVGRFKDILFYNDSIATIPEATIEAVITLGHVDTLILGGKDRGIDYSGLIKFLQQGDVANIVLLGEVGIRLYPILKKQLPPQCKLFPIDEFAELKEIIQLHTARNGICLLSPAASSYGMFKNFEERGQAFKKIARSI